MLDGRKRSVARALVASSFAITLAGVGIAASPVSAKPTPESVKAKVQSLYREAEIASEQLNNATAQAKQAKATLKALNKDFKRESASVDDMRQQVAAIVVAQYQGQPLTAASQVALAGNPSSFIQGINVMNGISTQQAAMLSEYKVQFDRLAMRRDAVKRETAILAQAQAKIAKEQRHVENATTEAETQLASLTHTQRAAVVTQIAGPSYSRSAIRVPKVSGMAGVAVRYALSQVGKSYVYGTSGPNTFDCSGLTMAAWGAAGVGLSHNSAAQFNEGTRISESELQPGDLVFYYGGISHVGIYIGDGKIVNAQNPSTGVRITSLHAMPYVGAVRLG